MEFRTLKYFLAIAREENMTAAANTLHVSQSALSRQMQDLEQDLGKPLFVRTQRKMLLTGEGRQLKKRAEEILSLVERTETEFKNADSEIYGEIHIGAGETRIMNRVSRAMRRLQSNHPMIKFRVFSGITDDITEKLEHGLLDFGLLYEPVNKEKYEYIRIPDKDTLGVLVQKEGVWGNYRELTPEDLKDMPLLLFSSEEDDKVSLSKWLGYDIRRLHVTATYNLLYNASIMVENGIGNALCIDGLIHTEGTNLRFVPLKPAIERQLVFVWKKNPLIYPAHKLFLEEIKREFEDVSPI